MTNTKLINILKDIKFDGIFDADFERKCRIKIVMVKKLRSRIQKQYFINKLNNKECVL